jgi:tetratricopeptide (TPR) repeat protein
VNLAELRALSGAPAAEIRRAMLGASTHPGALVRSVSSIMRARGYGLEDARLVLTGLSPPAVEEVAGVSDAMRAQVERLAPAARAEALGRIEAMLRAELERQPRAEPLRFRLAEAIVAASPARLPEADALYDAAVALFPQDPGVLANAAQVRLLTARPREALELLDAALAKAPGGTADAGGGIAGAAIVHQQRAAALLGVGRPADALTAIALASDLDKNDRELVRRLIELADALGREDVARAARDRQARQNQSAPPSEQRAPTGGAPGLGPAQRRERTNQP